MFWGYKSYTYISIVITLLFGITRGDLNSCDLKWVSDGYGSIPAHSIESGSNEYIARVYHENTEWIPGRISPSKGRVYITQNTEAFDYDTYEVLTNPDNCILEWADGYGGSIPADAVSVNEAADPTPPSVYIGRGTIAGLALAGKVVVAESAIFIAYDGKEEVRRNYQVLRSFYPPLKVRISQFNFLVRNFDIRATSKELVGQEEIQATVNSEMVHTVDHGKTVQERFTLTEEKDWKGFSHVSFSFPLWYGSSDVSAEFDLNPEEIEDAELTVYRDRHLRIQKDVSVKGGTPTSPTRLQACSTVTIVEDLEAPLGFDATATYEAENMSAEQVRKIMANHGRPISAKKSSRRNSVKGTIKGTLNGRFATYVSSYMNVAENPLCNTYVQPPIKN